MKAVYISGHGANEVVHVGTYAKPHRQAGHALVRLHGATLNRVDLYMRNSGAGITHQLPQVMGLDGAGVIEEIDSEDAQLKLGQQVVIHPGISCGRCEFCLRGEDVLCLSMSLLGEHRDGTFAQYISVPVRNVFAMPAHLSFTEAAALGVNHLTAWRMLFSQAKLQPQESILIFGIGGGVSLAALQLAKLTGAKVIVTSRDDNKLAQAKLLGADETINGNHQDISKAVMQATNGRGVDVVFENVGEAVWQQALKSLVRGGRLVTCGATSGDQPPSDLRRIFIRQLQILGSTLGNLNEFRDLLDFVKATQLKPIIDHEYTLDQIHAALTHLESGTQFGKLALRID